jgi:hypothetical protein
MALSATGTSSYCRPLSDLWPLTIAQVILQYEAAKIGPSKYRSHVDIAGFSGQSMQVSGFTKEQQNDLTLASMRLANNQINEACNKLYATIELAYAVRTRTFPGPSGVSSDSFSGEFVLGALVPVLYYSQVAALLSLLASFGMVLVHDKRSRRERQFDQTLQSQHWGEERESLIMRKRSDWNVLSRSTVGGNVGWHQQLLNVGSRFFATVADAAGFDFNLLKELKKQRELVDYGILAEISMGEVVGFQRYLKFLPRAHKNIAFCINLIKQVSGITNHCDIRMQKLEGSILRELLFEHPYSVVLELWKEFTPVFTAGSTPTPTGWP